MTFVAAYDASGHEGSPEILGAAGVVATEEAWRAFEEQWSAVLAEYNVSRFRHAKFKASEGDFKGWKIHEKKRQAFYGSLLDIMEAHVAGWAFYGMRVDEFARLSTEHHLTLLRGPYLMSASNALIKIKMWKQEEHPGETISHYIARGDRGQRPGVTLEQLFKHDDVISIHEYTKERGYYIPFQAADLVAGVRATYHESKQLRYPDRRLLAMNGIHDELLTENGLRGLALAFPEFFPSREQS